MATSNNVQIRFSKSSKGSTTGYADVKNLRNDDGSANATGIRVFRNKANAKTFKSKLKAIMNGLESRYPGEYVMHEERNDFALVVLNQQSLDADTFITGINSPDDDLPF